jgi:hypothetical protein
MVMNENDISLLRSKPNPTKGDSTKYPEPRFLGVNFLGLATGQPTMLIYRELEVNIWNTATNAYMRNWDPVAVGVHPGKTGKRLGGPWLRCRFYTATCPDHSKKMWLFDYNPCHPPAGETAQIPTATQKQINEAMPDPYHFNDLADWPDFDPNDFPGDGIL